MTKKEFDIATHELVSKHTLLSEKEKKILFEKYHISIPELPKIHATDPAIQHLKAKPGDVIKVVRKSQTAGQAEYYRGVISE